MLSINKRHTLTLNFMAVTRRTGLSRSQIVQLATAQFLETYEEYLDFPLPTGPCFSQAYETHRDELSPDPSVWRIAL